MKKIIIAAIYLFTSLAFGQTPPPVSLRGSPGVVNSPAWNLQVPLNQATKTGGISALIETGNYNILPNPNFEHLTFNNDWSSTGGAVIAGINVALGLKSANWDPSAANQFFSSALATIPQGLAGTNGEAFCKYQTSATDLSFSVLDGSGNTLGIVNPISATTSGWATARVNFVFPPVSGSGTAQVRFASASNSSDINVDDCYLGPATNIGTVSQATVYAAATLPATQTASCVFSQNTSTSENNYVSLAGASGCPAWVSSGPISMTTNTLHATFNNLPAGEYEVSLSAPFVNNSGNTVCNFRFSDGITGFGSNFVYTSAGGVLSNGTMIGRISYSAPQASVTWSVQASDSGATACSVSPDTLGRSANWIIKRFPTSSELAFRPDLQNWKVDANISGTSPSLGSSAVSSYAGIEGSALTLVNNSGSGVLTSQIPCSGTNPPTGTTCSVGNESMGVSFSIPRAGDVLACASFSQTISIGASGSVFATFQLVETANNSQTILQEGKSRIASGTNAPSQTLLNPMRVCGNFSFTSAGQKTIRLMYEQTTSGTVTENVVISDALAANGQRDVHFEVYPIDQQTPRPVLVGSVSSGSPGQERIERAAVTTSCTVTPCTIARQSGTFSSIARNSAGNYTANFAAGVFSAPPVCFCSGTNGSAIGCYSTTPPTTSSVTFVTYNAALSSSDSTFDLVCYGPRN